MTARYVTKDGDIIDAICFRHYGQTEGTVELVLEANPFLANEPITLRRNLTIILPEFTNPENIFTRIID
jgi:phage tail protein X